MASLLLERESQSGQRSIVCGIKGLGNRSIFVLANGRPLHPQVDAFLGHNGSPPGSRDAPPANEHRPGHPRGKGLI